MKKSILRLSLVVINFVAITGSLEAEFGDNEGEQVLATGANQGSWSRWWSYEGISGK